MLVPEIAYNHPKTSHLTFGNVYEVLLVVNRDFAYSLNNLPPNLLLTLFQAYQELGHLTLCPKRCYWHRPNTKEGQLWMK